VDLDQLKSGFRVRGLVAAGEVTVVAVEPHGDGIFTVVFRGDDGMISDRLAVRRTL
jgi:hypothetical protein